MVVGHGAGELLRAALRALARGGDVRVAWPGWGPLPRLVHEAGATPVPVAAEDLRRRQRAPPARSSLARPADPTGAVVALDDVAAGRRLAPDAWLILDEALAGFLPDGEDAIVDHPRVIHVRSFSKAHAMAGFRVGYAIVSASAARGLAPVLGRRRGRPGRRAVGGRERRGVARRRRAQAARASATRLAAALGAVRPATARTSGSAARAGRAPGRPADLRRPRARVGRRHPLRATLRDAAATDRLLAALRD